MSERYDPPPGAKVAAVERLLQLLAVLRGSDLPVPRAVLVAAVHDYAEDERSGAASSDREKAKESLNRKIGRDVKDLQELGFDVRDEGVQGGESSYVLRPTPWRVPLDLDPEEQAVLSWVMRAAGTSSQVVPESLPAASYADVLGSLPSGLGLVHAALAGRRTLVVDRNGEDIVLEPVQLAAHEGRWSVLARYPGSPQVYGYRLDRLDVVRLGEPLAVAPERVEDPLEVLDPTAWRKHPPADVELRCDPADRAHVSSWFPRAHLAESDGEVVLTFSATNTSAVLDRVLGLAGAVRVAGPGELREQLRACLLPFVGGAA